MSNYVFHPPQQNYHNNQKIDLGDVRISANIEIPEGVSQVVYNNNTIVDMSYDNVTPEVVHNGYMFHAANGNVCIGNYNPIDVSQDTVNPNVVINGYTFHDANGNALVGNYQPIDLSQDTITPEVVINGYAFHDASGNALVGSYDPPISLYTSSCIYANSNNYIPKLTGSNNSIHIIFGNGITKFNERYMACNNSRIRVQFDNRLNYEATNFAFMFNNCYGNLYTSVIGSTVGYFIRGLSGYSNRIDIPNSAINCAYMFYRCNALLGVKVYIGSNVKNCEHMFDGIQIGNSKENYKTNINIYFNNIQNVINVFNMFGNLMSSACTKGINIFTSNYNWIKTQQICNSTLTYTTYDENCIYNATKNIFIYDNYISE